MSCVFISENANEICKTFLNKNYKVIEIKKTSHVYEAVSTHADIYVCKVGNTAVIAPEQVELIQHDLKHKRLQYIKGHSNIGFCYPENIKYNGVCIGPVFIHNAAYTDKMIKYQVENNHLKIIGVKQGYTKCNVVEVDSQSIITSDHGIAKSLKEKTKIDVLLIRQGHVVLEGMPYGFLGGASGKVGNVIVFNGNLEQHPDFEIIRTFIKNRSIDITYFKEYPLKDIGSIIEIPR